MEESVACVRCSVNARHERKLKNKLGDCGCSLSNQLKAWIEKKKKKRIAFRQEGLVQTEGSSSCSLGLQLARLPCRHTCESVP